MVYSTLDSDCEISQNKKKLIRRIQIPVGLLADLKASDLRPLERDIIYQIAWATRNNRKCKQPLATAILDHVVSSRGRKRIKAFLRETPYIIESPGRYQAGEQSLCYEIASGQHNNDSAGRLVWRRCDLSELYAMVRVAWSDLGYDQSVLDAEWSIKRVDAVEIEIGSVDAKMMKKSGYEWKKPRKKGGAKTLEEMAAYHRLAMSRFWTDRMTGIFRRDGRQYHTALSIPRWIRRRVITFDRRSESVDVSACYAWILAARHRRSAIRRGDDTTQVDALLEMIESGQFYKIMAEKAGCDAEDAKQQFQIFCIFGDLQKHKLWYVLRDLCPGLCSDIMWWRGQVAGATRLSDMLTRAEGHLIDGVVRHLVSGGTPAVRYHDGIEVPAGTAHAAANWLSDHSMAIYGRRCRIAVTTAQGKSYV